ncbi:MAG: insulinase family protein [Eubacterium sp.]
MPEGIAHFLEHKLFESEDLDALKDMQNRRQRKCLYLVYKTCYLFQCSSNFKENLKILLDFVQNPYFTPQTVQKEQELSVRKLRVL